MSLPPTTRLLPRTYQPLFSHLEFRRLLPALVASDIGDGMSMVAVAWLAVLIAPPGQPGLVVGAADPEIANLAASSRAAQRLVMDKGNLR
ncbi:hypothetical protein ACFRQM_27045 [Streptomyces sp. NPDC056831]|uniref:hypothetical protein n=1 Tax=Streptomyces sp. NPDC056831 TaxID=3345954 RepID=UPI0036823D71